MLPQPLHVSHFKVVNGELQLLGQAHVAVSHGRARFRIARPHNVINRVHVLQKRRDALHSIRELGADGIEIHPAALLEVGELRNFQTVQHHLPAHAPRTARRPLPVVFFELQVVMFQVDAHGLERFEIKLLHVHRRRLQDQLELGVLEEPVRILAVAPVGRPPRGLRVAHPVGLRPQHAQKRLWTHGSRAHFHVVGLLDHASPLRPEALQAEQQILKGKRGGR